VSVPFSSTEIVARWVGPHQRPAAAGAKITGLAADSHFAAALLTLWHKVSQSGGGVDFGPTAGRAEIAVAVTDAVNGLRAGTRYAVALTVGNELIAIAFLIPRVYQLVEHVGEVRFVMVDPDHRGRGFGRQVMAEISRLAVTVGVTLLTLGVRAGRERFFVELGYLEYGRLPAAIRLPDGSSFDEILYRRPTVTDKL
jgi:GNAT superfamily N-acetyltransferase